MLVAFLWLILWIAMVGLVVWAIQTYIPMPPIFKTVITIIAVIFCVILLISFVSGTPLGGSQGLIR